MIMLALGLGVLALLFGAARAFSTASVATIKSFAAWVAALAGISLAGMLLLTGRGGVAIGGLMLVGPLVWKWWKQNAAPDAFRRMAKPASGSRMSRAEALQVLGLTDPVSESDVRAAYVRIMRVAHPDSGGSDWLATRVNQARDVLLGHR